jgi:iron complex outermembrane receptor protein
MRIVLLATAAAILVPATAHAQSEPKPATDQTAQAGGDDAFGLGQIVVTGVRPKGLAIGGDTLGQEAIYAFDRNSLGEAATLIPGVTAGNSGGSRNVTIGVGAKNR